MKLSALKLAFVALIGPVLLHTNVRSMTIQFGSEGEELVSVGEDWQFFRGTVAPSEPADAWYERDFNHSDWETGASGFGYGDDDDETVLDDMQNSYVTVYIRREFILSSPPGDELVQLVIDYDDGFVAYLNGEKVESRRMPGGKPRRRGVPDEALDSITACGARPGLVDLPGRRDSPGISGH